MNSVCKKLKKDITDASADKLNPYKDEFQPKDLGLKSSNYGSFSDHCKKGSTKSSKWCGCGLLKLMNKQKPFKYILIK